MIEKQSHAASPAFRILQICGIIAFGVLAGALALEAARGAGTFGLFWLLPLLAVASYVAADFISGFVHFLADNFGTPETPVIGRGFIQPFREHHDDPLGIVRHDFVEANGNNSLVAVPPMLLVWLAAPIGSSRGWYLFGAFFLFLCLSVFLTNQFHKWAHMDVPPGWVQRLQEHGIVLSKAHHDIHHVSPFDTYYCITVGWWNPFLERIGFFERAEALIRRFVPGVSRDKPEETFVTRPRERSPNEGAPAARE